MDEPRERLTPIYRAASEAEAEIVRGRLVTEELDVYLRPDPAGGGVLVIVPADQAVQARQLLSDSRPDEDAGGPDLQALHKAATEEEAQAVRAHLAREGIPSTVRREESAFGEQIVVMVPAELSYEASQSLSRFRLDALGS